MIKLTGYTVLEQIYMGSKTLVYRGIRESDQKAVVLKILRSEYPSFNELMQFRNQYTITRNLNLPGVIKIYNLENYRNSYALVMEDVDSISLKEWVKQWQEGSLGKNIEELKKFLFISLQIVVALESLYRNGIIHKDIKPSNILIHPHTLQIKIIDFSIASFLLREKQDFTSFNTLEGTLAYLSPEQTGRMNRLIDYRTDYYSLGVTFYEILTGQLPFTTTDPMELVHCHIARLPPTVDSINPIIPLSLASVVSKLMAKNAEERYQSTLGLKYDLEFCLEQLNKTGKISFFELGKRDISERFTIPEKLYGRSQEVKTLLAAFERVIQGTAEILLVAGSSGIGKTTVISEIHKPIVRARGYFIKGKFDQFQKNIPFLGFVQAFRDLMEQLLAQSSIQIAHWKEKILAALGEQGQVITEVIPELERIIGKQPPIRELSGSAAQNRFNVLFQKFIRIFTTAEHPLVIFLDDLQWVDLASLKLMQLIMGEPNAQHLLLIGAYRDNEVFSAHPLVLALKELRKTQTSIYTITLEPLKTTDLNQLVADTLQCNLNTTLGLTEIIYQKTQGNPFFVNQLLKLLYDNKIIHFNLEAGCWQYDLIAVRELILSDDVVDFMAIELQKLPFVTQEVLKLAACIGNQFDLATLATVYEKSQAETAADLWEALQAGLILPTNKVHKFYWHGIPELNRQSGSFAYVQNYKFFHDRVQQAAYSLIHEKCKQANHLKIGQLLLINLSEQELEDKVFEVVNQLNIGLELITNQIEKKQLACLNLRAAKKAKSSTAYEPALKYLNIGIKLLKESSWETDYKLTLALHIELVSVAYFNGDFDLMNTIAEVVIENAKNLLDKVKTYEVKIQSCMANSKQLEAMEIAISVLKLLDIKFPQNPTPSDLELAMTAIKTKLNNQPTKNLIDLPIMTDSYKLAAMRILSNATPAAYQAVPQMLPLIILKQVDLSIEYGNTADSAFGYANYGLILSKHGHADIAYQFCQLAERVLEKFQANELKCKTILNINTMVKHWKKHIRETLQPLLEAYTNGVETGDWEFAAYAAFSHCVHLYFMGKELTVLLEEVVLYSQAINHLNQEGVFYWNELTRQVILNLLNPTHDPCNFTGEAYNESIRLPLHVKANDRLIICYYYLHKLIISYLFSDIEQAIKYSDLTVEYLDGVPGMFCIPLFHFYNSLTLLAAFNHVSAEKKITFLNKIQSNQEKMQKWAQDAPMNYLHKFYLVTAELCRVQNNPWKAMEMYDSAISLAKENEYPQEEALGYELAAKFYLELGKEKLAQPYLIDAYYAYVRWGAKAKVADLETRYSQLLVPLYQQEDINFNPMTTLSILPRGVFHSTSTGVNNILDFAAVMKASVALSQEIHLEPLLTKLMQVVMENVGAQKCALLLNQDSQLTLVATGNQTSNSIHLLKMLPLEEIADLPISVINYVQHTTETLLLDDTVKETRFASDPYINQWQPQSVLCLPMLNKGKLTGILYLENNLTTGVFVGDRLEVLKLLCAQAAILLENAKLYQDLQTFNQALQTSETRERQKAQQLEQSLQQLQQAQLQLVQSEKMSALGNLVAGIAHEINNPVGFIGGNIQPAVQYVQDLFYLLDLYQKTLPNPGNEIAAEIEAMDLEYVRSDLLKLLNSMQEGVNRIRNISDSLRTFSRADTENKITFNIHEGLDSTILILKHRLKANALRPAIQIVKEYAELPVVNCFPGQLNQVFMNILANAIDALEESNSGRSFTDIQNNPNKIIICTEMSAEQNQIIIRIRDNGLGMSEEVQKRVFDHLFTTKSVGKGTGLGLSIARQIVEEKHSGKLKCFSTLGQGTEFVIEIPLYL